MKVASLDLRYFKRFKEYSLDLCDEAGFPKNLIVLIGDNGAGKTSLLQAIALTVGRAAHLFEDVHEFRWRGFDIELAHANWRIPPNSWSVKCKVAFEPGELEATREYYDLTGMAQDERFVPPGKESPVTLYYFPNGEVRADSPAALFQFRGYEYAKQVVRLHSEGRNIFTRVGSVVWYTQHRLATSLAQQNGETAGFDINRLRQRLGEWQNVHLQIEQGTRILQPHQRDLYGDLREAYRRLFPDRDFAGAMPRDPAQVTETSWFLMTQGNEQYEISEMSAGEQAIFPILLDFVNWNIHHSIVLIDEVGLHLHPPLQQAFVRGLQALGNDNQFIITTHSEDVLAAVPDDSVYRIEG
jgi:predicted ATPase